MFSFSLISLPDSFSVDPERVQEIIALVDQEVNIPQRGMVHLAFLMDDEIRALNHQYRGKDTTTDVLSFHYFEDFSALSDADIAGECVFSESRILLQAEEQGHAPEREFETLLIHSLLHLLGYDHESDEEYIEMWEVEKKIREKVSRI